MTSRWIAGGVVALGLAVAFLPNGRAAAETYAPLPQPETGQAVATFAGGCFWCVEADFDKIDGVLATTSGYTGGAVERPSYKQVTYTETGHYEAVQVLYDPSVVDYDTLVDAFWRTVDVTDDGGQFCDRGTSYRTAVFATPEQREAAEASKAEAQEALGGKIVTPILDAQAFYPAEIYHQDYYLKNPFRYRGYRAGCGRDKIVKRVWGDEAYAGIPGKS